MNKPVEIHDAIAQSILDELKIKGFNPAAVKAGIEYLKVLKYEVPLVPGSKVEEVQNTLEGMPSFKMKQG